MSWLNPFRRSRNGADRKGAPDGLHSLRGRAVFRAFHPSEFMPGRPWERLQHILQANGGCYGLTGARGAGKTWLMLQAIDWARERRGIGLWFPSPGEYHAEPFLLSLAETFASEVQRRFARYRQRWYHVLRPPGVLLVGLSLVAFGASHYVLRQHGLFYHDAVYHGVLTPWIESMWLGIPSGSLLIAGNLLSNWLFASSSAGRKVYAEAETLRERVRFSSTQRQKTEVGADAGASGLAGSFKTSRERELVERTLTVASLVYELRALAEQAAEAADAPVVIAIDELDKIADTEAARALLRDIKGIFEIPGVHFLVSISYEAARTLELGAELGRDEFSSSFYTVIDLEAWSPPACHALVEARLSGLRPAVGHALGILAAGNPREVLRLADLYLNSAGDEGMGPGGLDDVVRALAFTMRSSALAFRRDVVTSKKTSASVKTVVFQAFRDEIFERDCFAREALALGVQAGDAASYLGEFSEPWRRLLVRFHVCATVAAFPSFLLSDAEYGERLLRVVVVSEQSAELAWRLFAEYFSESAPRQDKRAAGLSLV